GDHSITAQYAGDANDAGSISPALTQTVNSVMLVSISVSPAPAANPSVPVGLSQQYIATASYSDGSSADITAQAAWSSSNGGVATVSNGLAKGLATGGPVTLTAASGSVSGTSALTVTNAALLAGTIIILPSAATIPAGCRQQFIA